MNGLFYHANFCAECGNRIDARSGWRPTYFCAECRRRRDARAWLRPLGPGLLGLLLGVFGLSRSPHPDEERPAASARDASLVPRPALPAPPPVERVACGARTRKGTPCKRLVPPGTRCAQHRGKPAMRNAE